MSEPNGTISPAPPAPPAAAPMLPATRPPAPLETVRLGMDTLQGFEGLQRAGKLLSVSPLVPKDYRDNPASCAIALNLANRIGCDPLMVMQNLFIVQGRPGWGAQFLIATFNSCGRFTALRFEFSGAEGTDEWGCRAWAVELSTNQRIQGAKVTIKLAKAEQWVDKNGSKWKTMPEQMLMYRCASWFIKAYAPEVSMGLQTKEELEDIEGEVIRDPAPANALPGTALPAIGTTAAPTQPAAAAQVPATASNRLARLKPKDVTPVAEEVPEPARVNADDKIRREPLIDPNEQDLPWPTE